MGAGVLPNACLKAYCILKICNTHEILIYILETARKRKVLNCFVCFISYFRPLANFHPYFVTSHFTRAATVGMNDSAMKYKLSSKLGSYRSYIKFYIDKGTHFYMSCDEVSLHYAVLLSKY